MSRLSDLELQAEQLNRGVEELYYGEEWPSEPWPSEEELEQDEINNS